MPTPATTNRPQANPGTIPAIPPPLPPDGEARDENAAENPPVPLSPIEAENKAIHSAGRNFGRTIDCWRDICQILSDGFQRNPNIDPSHYTGRQRRHHALYDMLLSHAPFIRDIILARGPTSIIQVATLLESGRSAARSDDVSTVKKSIGGWHEFSPSLTASDKKYRGFRHDECGLYICPIKYNYNDRAVKEGLKNQSPDYPIGYKLWPRFLWRDLIVHQDDFHCGFLMNELIVLFLLHLLVGPSAAIRAMAPDATANENFRGKRKGNAAKHGVRSVTTGLIAYAVMLIRFGLCNQRTFGAGGKGAGWPYRDFYQHLARYIDEDMPVVARRELFTWLNSRVFPDIYEDSDRDVSDDENDPSTSTAAMMRAQVNAQRAESGTILAESDAANMSESAPATVSS
ncbi:hypothetical protein JAAARDRAFT_41362 [Jaapia argillacea MUCL 33604]|uniref:Uncharacterized protein n=1 Tax=Jaapia argillacea MUCL 33604 TaxID=933084 RepID=A0A067PJU7_9AGAM|nr:hypothetical protein JAAARDRAFT_41362 [Jaapia argillacea MUCL 33604]